VKEAFDLKLTEVPAAAKIKIIKEIRAITGLGLKEVRHFLVLYCTHAVFLTMILCDCVHLQAKEMVEKAPVVVKQGLKKDEADKLKATLLEAGGKAELL
jgi:large subunit ribosomal protein L7/L12